MKITTQYFSKVTKISAAVAFAVSAASAHSAVDPVDFTNATGFGSGVSTFQVSNIRLNSEVVNPFDPSRPQIITYTYNVPFRFDLATLHLIPELTGARPVTQDTNCASLSLAVTDAFTGNAISGATANVGMTPATANSTGTASFSGLTAGSTSVTVTATGYNTASRVVELSCTTPTSVGVSLNPTTTDTSVGGMVANAVRVVLNWGANPRDLDSHLTGPTSTSTGNDDTTNRYHTYFSSRTRECDTSNATVCVTRLDRDDTDGMGPETITISPPTGSTTLRPGIYRYSVHHFSGTGTIATSGATVSLILGSGSERTFTPAASTTLGGSGSVWTVFELMVDTNGAVTVLPVDSYSTVTSAGSVRSRTGLGAVENGIDFTRLPAK